MANGANTTRIGAFVILGILLIVAAIAIFGGGRLFRDSRQFVMNFSASMQGLSRGSPVMLSGVPIGEVTNILVRLNEQTLEYESAVLVNIFPDRFDQSEQIDWKDRDLMPGLIDRGLRARLVPTSIVTGQLGIELGFYPGTPVRLTGSKPGYKEIPTIPSTVERLETTAQKILALLEGADLDELSASVERSLLSFGELMAMPETRQTVVDASAAVRELRQLVTQIKTEVPATLAGLRATASGAQGLVAETQRMLPTLQADISKLGPALARADALLGSADALIRNVNAVAAPDSQLQAQLANALRDLTRTSAAVRSLVTAIEDNPNSVLFGSVRGTNP